MRRPRDTGADKHGWNPANRGECRATPHDLSNNISTSLFYC